MSSVKSDFSAAFGARLKEARERMGMSQEAFGDLAGVHKKTQGLYESGERSPDAEYLERIRQAGCDVDVLFGRRHETNDERRGPYRVDPEGELSGLAGSNSAAAIDPSEGGPGVSANKSAWREILVGLVETGWPSDAGWTFQKLVRVVDLLYDMDQKGIKRSLDVVRKLIDEQP